MTATNTATAVLGGNATLFADTEVNDASPGCNNDLLVQEIKQVLEEQLSLLQHDIQGIKKLIDFKNHGDTADDTFDDAASADKPNKNNKNNKKKKNNKKRKNKNNNMSAQKIQDNGSCLFKWTGAHRKLNPIKWIGARAVTFWFVLGIRVSRGPWPFLDHCNGFNDIGFMMGNVHLAAAQPVMDPSMIPMILKEAGEEEAAKGKSREKGSSAKALLSKKTGLTALNLKGARDKLLADKMNCLHKIGKSRTHKMARKFSSSCNRGQNDCHALEEPDDIRDGGQALEIHYYYLDIDGRKCNNAAENHFEVTGLFYLFEAIEECCAIM